MNQPGHYTITNVNPHTREITLQCSEEVWAPGCWAGSEGLKATLMKQPGHYTITNVNLDTREVTLQCSEEVWAVDGAMVAGNRQLHHRPGHEPTRVWHNLRTLIAACRAIHGPVFLGDCVGIKWAIDQGREGSLDRHLALALVAAHSYPVGLHSELENYRMEIVRPMNNGKRFEETYYAVCNEAFGGAFVMQTTMKLAEIIAARRILSQVTKVTISSMSPESHKVVTDTQVMIEKEYAAARRAVLTGITADPPDMSEELQTHDEKVRASLAVCDCGARVAKTTHERWCKTQEGA